MASFKEYSKENMVVPNPSLLHNPGASRNYGPVGIRFIASRQKPSEIASLDEQLQDLLHKKVAQCCLLGHKEETLQQHRWQVLCQVATWLQLFEKLQIRQDEWVLEELLTLLSKNMKCKNLKQIPREEAEWHRLLSQWLRQFPSEDVIDRQVYRLLAVDGLEGFEAKDLKSYLSYALNPKDLREEYRQHTEAVRSMYDWIDKNPEISSLMGIDSACIVFLALLQLFERKLNALFSDDNIAMQTYQARRQAEGFLYRNANYYRDVRKVTEVLLNQLSDTYEMAWKEKDWRQVGTELVMQFVSRAK